MAKSSAATSDTDTISSATIFKDIPPSHLSQIASFFRNVGVGNAVPEKYSSKNFYTDLVCGLLKVDRVQRGRITCVLSVKPVVTNFFGTLHGGAVASVAEILSIACARTVVAEDKELFLGELSLSYLSAAPQNAELTVDASVVRSGRNVTVIAVEFKHNKTGKLIYTARATFYNMPVASL